MFWNRTHYSLYPQAKTQMITQDNVHTDISYKDKTSSCIIYVGNSKAAKVFDRSYREIFSERRTPKLHSWRKRWLLEDEEEIRVQEFVWKNVWSGAAYFIRMQVGFWIQFFLGLLFNGLFFVIGLFRISHVWWILYAFIQPYIFTCGVIFRIRTFVLKFRTVKFYE